MSNFLNIIQGKNTYLLLEVLQPALLIYLFHIQDVQDGSKNGWVNITLAYKYLARTKVIILLMKAKYR